MARSYFSRLVRGGESALLAPPRPVTNLWKSAQIDSAVSVPDAGPVSTSHRNPMQRSRVSEPALNPTEVESWQAPHLSPARPVERSSRTRTPQISAHGETERPALAAEPIRRAEGIRQDGITRRDAVTKAAQEQTAPAIQARGPAAPALTAASSSPSVSAQSVSAQSVSIRSASTRRELSTQPASPAPSASAVEAKPLLKESRLPDAVEPIPPIAGPAAEKQQAAVPVSVPQGHAADAAHASPAPVAAAENPAPQPRSGLQPIEWATPVRSREPSRPARQNSTPEQPSAKGNTVQIGKIEVQVVPPLASSYRPAPAAQPKARLARGYSLWQGY